jgi:flagellar basal-body rod protein FlgB
MTTQGDMFSKGSTAALGYAMSFAEQRHKVLARNVANVETPGYVAQDLPKAEFTDLLRRSFAERDSRRVGTFRMHEGRGVYLNGHSLEAEARDSGHGPLRNGENNVDIDHELATLARNAMEYRTFSGLLHKKFQLMRDTIAGRA